MSRKNIEIALQTALNAMSPALATQWPNKDFEPVHGTPYQSVSLLSQVDADEFSGGYREIGYLQINLMYPSKSGSGDALTRADLIRTTFRRGNTYVYSGTTVIIDKTADIMPSSRDGDRFLVPVRVYFYSNING